MSSIFGLIVLVLVASTLQAGTGFGFSIMATPFLLLLFDPHDAIQLNIILFIFLDVRILKILVSFLILSSTALLVAKINVKQTNTKELITGALSELLTTSLGMPGPPLLIYFAGAKVDKSTLRGTALAYFVFVLPISLLLQFSMYSISKGVWISTLWALPFAVMGIYLGQWVFTRLNQQLFEKIIYTLLFFTGIYLLIIIF
ncbi:sulfite exporter TauE/SafE family protein [Desulfosporosinus sp. BICA1-9]|uniref:sulfite exporter TauE/SafE family protein n=1 Tax=Desulfosporosinus sp. BICA1-9 TaxID=1531958 RepID=UPI00054C073D|nr:sulfite exporter TauE/SafE family protein [Desulfosporosinus sp. BICA1-9]KJS47000.1 MAG: membrane protein [Peptococcaceae bacterium BRH_c23]KJS82197.1 MAG: membrane protein [Desulfosporosinus sp. BICA1-9]HBW39013.1 sulfite exporter TauE/SafE family protein [Desulfosporosinus sp.]